MLTATFKQSVEFLAYHTKKKNYHNAMLWFDIVCRYAKQWPILQLRDDVQKTTAEAFNYLMNESTNLLDLNGRLFTDAEILALNETPIVLIPAPGNDASNT